MYRKISDYGLMGDMHSIALVSRDGSVDYCSMPHIDSPTVFAALLDDKNGGHFSIQPASPFSVRQYYEENTNVLTSEFSGAGGSARLRSFMAVHPGTEERVRDHLIHRCLRVHEGRLDFLLTLIPRPSFAQERPRIERRGDVFQVRAANETFTFIIKGAEYRVTGADGGDLRLAFSLGAGGEAHFDFIYGIKRPEDIAYCSFDATNAFWDAWMRGCTGGACLDFGEYSGMAARSLLVLKLLTFEPTKAIAAAPTTSLPEFIGGERNWDYRYTWLRDASFTLQALFNAGHIEETLDYIRWLRSTFELTMHGEQKLQIAYSLSGGTEEPERVLDHLEGYRGSRPVRTGNAAFTQRQWDVFGEIMDSAYRLSLSRGKIDEVLWPFFVEVCGLAMQHWKEPDEGIWEVRNGPFHFVYSKVMCWVALDRGIAIARRYGLPAPLEQWEAAREEIRNDVISRGYDPRQNSFVQHYGTDEVDASLLLLCLVGFLPVRDPRMQGTIRACEQRLMKDGFLMRYRSPDGLQGSEGAFVVCNFWLVQCRALSGDLTRAKDLLGETVKAANHLGLFSEQYDPRSGEQLGNFPQAFSHIGYINAVAAIREQEARKSRIKTLLTRLVAKLIYK